MAMVLRGWLKEAVFALQEVVNEFLDASLMIWSESALHAGTWIEPKGERLPQRFAIAITANNSVLVKFAANGMADGTWGDPNSDHLILVRCMQHCQRVSRTRILRNMNLTTAVGWNN